MGISPESIEAVRRTVDLADLISQSVPLKGAGKDLFGLCPFHADKDPSFSVNNDKRFYYCFGCGAKGDVIDFVRRTRGLSFVDAVKTLAAETGIPIEEDRAAAGPEAYEISKGSRVRGVEGSRVQGDPADKPMPPPVWMEKAAAFVRDCHDRLMASKPALKKLEKTRGITPETAARHQLGMNPADYWRPRRTWGLPDVEGRDGKIFRNFKIDKGLVIPGLKWPRDQVRATPRGCPGIGQAHGPGPAVFRIRVRRPSGEPKYKLVPGSVTGPLVIPASDRVVLVVESELCAMLCAQEIAGMATVIAMGSARARPDAAAQEVLSRAHVILGALDFDDAGKTAQKDWIRRYPSVVFCPVPEGKDPTDAFLGGIDLKAWIKAGIPGSGASGPSLLNRKLWGAGEEEQGSRGRGVEGSSEEEGSRVQGVEDPSDDGGVPPGVRSLADLLKGQPVVIVNSTTRLTVKYPRSWAAAHWDRFKKITDAIYLDPAVFHYVTRHPHQEIRAENLVYENA